MYWAAKVASPSPNSATVAGDWTVGHGRRPDPEAAGSLALGLSARNLDLWKSPKCQWAWSMGHGHRCGPLGSRPGPRMLDLAPWTLFLWPWTLGLGVRAVVRRVGSWAVGPRTIAPIPSRVPWAFSRVRPIAVLGPRPPKTVVGLLRLGFRQGYGRVVSGAEKFAARGLYAIAQSLSGMWRVLYRPVKWSG